MKTINPILEKIFNARKGQYCHCVEVNDVYELETIADQITVEFQDEHTEEEIIDFLESLTVYALDDANEEEIFNFSFKEYIAGTL